MNLTDIDGLVSMRDKKFMHTIAAVPESATLGDDPATEPVQRENKSRPERAASARRFTRLQEAGSAGEQDRMFNKGCPEKMYNLQIPMFLSPHNS